VFADSIDALERDLPVVIYCASGYRSQVAASVLAAAGFADVSDLLGGYGAWRAAGLPVAGAGDHIVACKTPQVSARRADPARSRGDTPRRPRARRMAGRARARRGVDPDG
jgi:3-mercaptopyruvate sulfurtransferase SseA